MRISLGHPKPEEEIEILDAQQFIHPIEKLEQVVSVEELLQASEDVKQVYVDPLIKEYIVAIVNATRNYPDAYLGASPRGSLALYKTSQALAALQGRDFVIPDDIKALAEVTPSAQDHRQPIGSHQERRYSGRGARDSLHRTGPGRTKAAGRAGSSSSGHHANRLGLSHRDQG